MTELTPEQQYWSLKLKAQRFKLIGIALIAIGALLFFLVRSCGREQEAGIAYNAIRDTLQSVLDDTARVNAEARRLRHEKEDIDLKLADAIAEKDLWQDASMENAEKAKRLSLEVQKAKTQKDTPAYYKNCDELAQTNLILEGQLQEQMDASQVAASFYVASLKLMDSTAKRWEDAYRKCLKPVEFVAAELPKLEPKGKWYVDIAGMSGGAIIGAGGGLTYVDKNDRMYTVDVLGTNYKPVVLGKVGVPLLGRRKK